MDIWEITMTNDLGLRIRLLKILQQEIELCFLGWRTSIGIATFLVESSFIADTDGMLVVVADMSTSITLIAALNNVSIAIYIPVVADHLPTTSLVPAINIVASHML